MKLSTFDPKNLFPRVFKLGQYTWKLNCHTKLKVELDKKIEPKLYSSMSNLFDNYHDFQFRVTNPNTWEMEIPKEILKSIGSKKIPL